MADIEESYDQHLMPLIDLSGRVVDSVPMAPGQHIIKITYREGELTDDRRTLMRAGLALMTRALADGPAQVAAAEAGLQALPKEARALIALILEEK